MIGSAAHDQGFEAILASDSTDERPEPGLHIFGNKWAAVFRRKDAVHEENDIGV